MKLIKRREKTLYLGLLSVFLISSLAGGFNKKDYSAPAIQTSEPYIEINNEHIDGDIDLKTIEEEESFISSPKKDFLNASTTTSSESLALTGVSLYQAQNGNQDSNFSHLSVTNDSEISLTRGSKATLEFSNFEKSSSNILWSTSSSENIEFLDNFGSFWISDQSTGETDVTITCQIDGTTCFNKTIKIKDHYFSGGLGSETSPYLVSNRQDLIDLMNTDKDYWSYYFKQTCDIDAKNTPITIGRDSLYFKGNYDGDYHTITNLTYGASENDVKDTHSLALFGYSEGTIKNLSLSNVRISTGKSSNRFQVKYVASLIGQNWGDVINCHASRVLINVDFRDSSISLDSNYENYLVIGGLIARNEGERNERGHISQCSVDGVTIYSSSFASAAYRKNAALEVSIGGFIGATRKNGSVEGCIAKNIAINNVVGSSTSSDYYTEYAKWVFIGGFFGDAQQTTFKNCVSRNILSITNKVYRAKAIDGKLEMKIGAFGGAASIDYDNATTFENILSYGHQDNFFTDLSASELIEGQENDYGEYFAVSSFVNETGDTVNKNPIYSKATTYCKDLEYSYLDAAGNKIATTTASLEDKGTSLASTNEVSSISWVKALNSTTDLHLVNNQVEINKTYVSSVSFNLDEAKTGFDIGEAFSTGNIEVTLNLSGKTSAANTSVIEDQFSVDASSFNNEVAGVYTISVSSHGYQTSYEVEVIDPSAASSISSIDEIKKPILQKPIPI